MHNWADPYAKKIVKNLRASATLETKLVISDSIIPYSCAAVLNEEIPGAAIPSVPVPLLPSLGKVSSFSYQLDLTVYFFVEFWTCNTDSKLLDVDFIQQSRAHFGPLCFIIGRVWLEGYSSSSYIWIYFWPHCIGPCLKFYFASFED